MPQPALTAEQRGAALEAIFELARARIARQVAARDEALKAYASAWGRLPMDPSRPRLVAFRRDLEAERSGYAAEPSVASAAPVPASADDLVFYDVHDLVAAMERLGFPRVELVGPEGTRTEPREAVLGGHLYTLLPVEEGPITLKHVQELETRAGVLLLRASYARHQAMNTYLSTLRTAWPALWPEALAPNLTPSPAPAPPPVAAAEPQVVETHAVADLVHAVAVLGGLVDVGSPEEAASERLRGTLAEIVWRANSYAPTGGPSDMRYSLGESHLVVKATPAQQAAVAELLGTWREKWKARWPEAFPTLPPHPDDPLSGLEPHR